MEISDAQLVLELAKEKMVKAVEYLENELATYRVGKANPSVFFRIDRRLLRNGYTTGTGVQYFCPRCKDNDHSALGEKPDTPYRKSHYGGQSGVYSPK